MKENGGHSYTFGGFRFDGREKILYHGAAVVPLKPKAAELLGVLLENPNSVISKDKLMNAVWQNTFVEENNLSVNIYELRKAFAKFAPPEKYIETVSRRGFRFNAAVEKISPAADNNSPEPNVQKNSGESFAEDLPPVLPESSPMSANPTAVKPAHFDRRVMIAALLLVVLLGGAWLFARQENPPDKNAVSKPERGTKSVEAYQYYLRGRELWQTRQNPKMEEGIVFFRRAIELDPNFAAPYIGIADSLSMMRNDPEEWRQAEEFVNKALALNPLSADAHASLAFILSMDKWQWTEAEREFQNALALDENSGKAHQWYANLLMIERRFDEAEAHLKKAIEIEPLSPTFNGDLCQLYDYANRYQDAYAQCRRVQQINPDFQFANSMHNFYIRQKRYDEAAEEKLQYDVRNGVTKEQAEQADWYQAFKKGGFEGWMRAEIKRDENPKTVILAYYGLSLHYAQLGDREKTLEYLEKSYAGHSFMLPFANAAPEFDFLRDDPRFQDLMRRMNLPPAASN